MAKKSNQRRNPAAALPPGIKPSRRAISARKLKMLMEDRGIASGGRNIVQRKPAASPR